MICETEHSLRHFRTRRIDVESRAEKWPLWRWGRATPSLPSVVRRRISFTTRSATASINAVVHSVPFVVY
jgi:hypothetical protein